MEQLITIKHRVETFARLLNTAAALLNKIRDDYEKIRKRSGFYAFFLPGSLFKVLDKILRNCMRRYRLLIWHYRTSKVLRNRKKINNRSAC